MEMQYSSVAAAAKRLRSLLAFTMDYLKCLFLKRGKLLGKVVLRKTLALLLSHHHHPKSSHHLGPSRILEYEFSCSNSPDPAAFRKIKRPGLRANAGFFCFGFKTVREHDEHWMSEAAFMINRMAVVDRKRSPLPPPFRQGRVLYDSSEEEEEEDDGRARNFDVDNRAEEFIKMFYEELRAQNFATFTLQDVA